METFSNFLSVITPILTAVITGLMSILLSRVNSRIKRAELQAEARSDEAKAQEAHLNVIQNNQENISRNFELISELAHGHALLTAETERQRTGMKVLLRNSLMNEHRLLMKQGFISSYQLRDFEEAYDVYHKEGGNGTATRWLEEVRSLPVEDEF